MRLYGTFTSPFVRRVRIVAREVGEPIELVDTSTPEGQSALRAVAPLGKVPVAELDGEVWFDSRVISDLLVARRGVGRLRGPSPGDANVRTVADGALDAMVNLFYLVRRDGADPAVPYLARQSERVDEALDWLASRLDGSGFAPGGGLGLPEIAVATTLAWAQFRQVWPVEERPVWSAFLASCEARPSFQETRPGVVGPG